MTDEQSMQIDESQPAPEVAPEVAPEADGAGSTLPEATVGGADSARQKTQLSRAFGEDGALKTHVGGQALLEGIMMRGKHNWAAAIREPTGGIYVATHDLASGEKKNKWMYWPLIRGCRALVESLTLGYKALEIAAEHAFVEEGAEEGIVFDIGQPDAEGNTEQTLVGKDELVKNIAQRILADQNLNPFEVNWAEIRTELGKATPEDELLLVKAKEAEKQAEEIVNKIVAQKAKNRQIPAPTALKDSTEAGLDSANTANTAAAYDKDDSDDTDEEPLLGKGAMVTAMVLGLVLGIGLFVVAPAFLTNLMVGEYDSNIVLWNVVDGLLRVGVFVGYLWLIGRMKDIKRMFGYHGAEHKAIHCYEHGLELTPDNARNFPRLHVRCGTAFLIMVMIIAIIVFTAIPLKALFVAWGVPDGMLKLLLVIAVRILFLPVIAGLSYEITVKWAGNRPNNPLVKIILWPGMQLQYLTTNEPDDGQIECAIVALQEVLKREEAEAQKAQESTFSILEPAAG
ncbi:MAG: DUF1385 domain-containing protein [Eggerthellaceae bacterium]|nr:DUF1385 domain-containing protein [Eggerthellaceae bacterium]